MPSRRPRLRLAAGLLASVLIAVGAAESVPAAAAPYPPTSACGASAFTAFATGTKVGLGLAAWGFAPGERVDVALGTPAVVAATYSANSAGSIRVVLVVSRSQARTAQRITASSGSAFCTANSTVVGAVVPGGSGGPNGTGGPNGPGGTGGASPSRPGGPGSGSGSTTGAPGTDGASSPSSPSSPSTLPSRSVPPRLEPEAGDQPTVVGLPAWLIAGISLGLLVLGLLAARTLTNRGDQ